MGGYVPALSKEEWDRYDNIGRKTVVAINPPTNADDSLPRAPISGGILNGRAIKLAKPGYPRAAREAHVSGTVEV